MNYSLRTKLSLSYVLVTLLMVSVISYFTNFLLEKQFKDYIIKQQEQKNKEIVALITQQYKDDNSWSTDVIENIGLNVLEQGLIIKVKDKSDKVIWDATLHNNGLCMQMFSHMAQNMNSRYPNFKGGYVENKYPILKDFNQVGKVEIGYYGPFYFTDNDLRFINTLNNALIAVGVFSLFFALILGAIMARRLSKPISRVISTADQISKGYFGDRILEKSSTKEILQLTGTINNLAETLEKQEMLRKRMAADVAHELRTPLATLQSHMEALIDGIWKPDVERFKSCHEEVLRINRMVGDLEKLARFENENILLDKSQFNVSELIQRITHNFETDFKNKNIEISINGKEETIFADRDKVSQVVVNLLSNALKYTPEGGAVSISVGGNEKNIEISVKDNGHGISPEDLPYIFERFYRADKSRNRSTGGSGIGLTIAKAIVEAHKGSITVKSELEKGTEFIVTLPKQVTK
ncbi:MAG: ATP-binding protein [Clostridiales bacterium]|nr:ATP-binding protein [Eubacteriales bacterium]MDH7567846.1 ATP-binding protein [Clostridiales bacterium]